MMEVEIVQHPQTALLKIDGSELQRLLKGHEIKQLRQVGGLEGFLTVRFERGNWYRALVVITSHKPRAELCPKDREGNPVGEYTFTCCAVDAKTAEENILDQVHETIPMSAPEDFDIEVQLL